MSEWYEVQFSTPKAAYPVHALNVTMKYEAIMAFDGREWHELDRALMSKGIGFYPTHWRELPTPPNPNTTEQKGE